MEQRAKSEKVHVIACGAIARELMESQFFGHERGAFTGATSAHAGYFEEVGGEGYDGRCFVFDERVALDAQLRPLVDQPLPEPKPSAF